MEAAVARARDEAARAEAVAGEVAELREQAKVGGVGQGLLSFALA